jgi:hypothetical protein
MTSARKIVRSVTGKLAASAGGTIRDAAAAVSVSYPQPPVKPISNNAAVFLFGLISGFAIGVCLTFFLIKMLELVM